MDLTTRRQHVLTGIIAVVLVAALTTVGVKGAFGAFDGGYEISGTFDAAGQGLLPGSDVKIRGVNVGEVRRIELDDGAALITLTIHDGEEIPTGSSATIRAKTLFGEKFVDIDPDVAPPGAAPLPDGGVLTETEGGFELEEVLTDTVPVLRAIDPDELMTVLHELAAGADGLGDEVNRTLVNGSALSEVFAENAENTEQFLQDLALLSQELAGGAEDIVAIAEDANIALPTLHENEEALSALLDETSRLSRDVADLLEANQPFLRAAFVDGTRSVDFLYDHRGQIIPTVVGLRQYVEVLTSVVRIDVGDGTLMAAVKGILGGDACGLVPCPGVDAGGAASAGTAPTTTPTVPAPLAPAPATPDPDDGRGLADLLEKLLGA